MSLPPIYDPPLPLLRSQLKIQVYSFRKSICTQHIYAGMYIQVKIQCYFPPDSQPFISLSFVKQFIFCHRFDTMAYHVKISFVASSVPGLLFCSIVLSFFSYARTKPKVFALIYFKMWQLELVISIILLFQNFLDLVLYELLNQHFYFQKKNHVAFFIWTELNLGLGKIITFTILRILPIQEEIHLFKFSITFFCSLSFLHKGTTYFLIYIVLAFF